MTDAQLNALWGEITRTARPEARVVFRTAAEPTLLPGRVDMGILDRWTYAAEQSRALTAARSLVDLRRLPPLRFQRMSGHRAPPLRTS